MAALLTRPWLEGSLFLKGHSISQCHSNRKPLSEFSPSLSGQLNKESTPAFRYREQKRPQPEPLAVLICLRPGLLPDCHIDFVPSCEIQLEGDQNQLGSDSSKGIDPTHPGNKVKQLAELYDHRWIHSPSPDLSQIVSEPESSEGIILSHAQTAST